MVDLPLKFEAGGMEQFTLTTSVALDANPLFFIKDGAGTLVSSGTASSSGDGFYYEYATIPTSKDLYTSHWWYSINAQSFQAVDVFEVVQTLAFKTTGQYCNFADVVNLYEPIRGWKIAYHEIDDKILDVQARIDARLGAVYPVPFATGANSLPPVIGTITKNLTMVAIIRQKGKNPDWIDELNQQYMDLLADLRSGDATLVLPDGSVITPTVPAALAQVHHSMEDYSPTFNMLGYELQRIDPDLLDDQEDAL